MTPRLKERYNQEIVPALIDRFQYTNMMQAPRLEKISVNIGLGEALQNPKSLEAASTDIITITGQKPVIRKRVSPLPPTSCAKATLLA